MKGTTYKRKLPSGRISWCLGIDLGRDQHGKRRRIFKSGFRRQGDADDELRRILHELNEGSLVKPDPRTVAEFLDQWIAEYATRKVAPTTLERYQELAGHVKRAIGTAELTKVTTLQLQRVYNGLLDAGKKNGKGLAVKTVRHVHGLVHVAMETAVKWGLLKINPAHACDLPPMPQQEAKCMDQDGTTRFMEAADRNWLRDLFGVAFSTGARRGELLALAWTDVDLDNAVLTIRKSLEQTKHGLRVKETKGRKIRRLNLPEASVQLLRELKERQQEARRMFGFDYRSDLDLVFCHPDGNYIRPDVVTKAARRIAKKAGLAGISLHTIRHSHGSQLLSLGVPLPAVSKRLGHANVHVTATVYSHALPDDEVTAAQIWNDAMSGTLQRATPAEPRREKKAARVVSINSGKKSA
ncbi:MAG: tyrosine-type recombinase/integrase [Bryobacteraceae bacterium]|jgi:integrase